MRNTRLWILVSMTMLAACTPENTKVLAPEKEYVPEGSTSPWKLGGVFDTKEKTLQISINGDNVINNAFPPFTPRLTADGKYAGKAIEVHCAFASGVLGGKGIAGGLRGKIAAAIVSKSTSTGGNTCDVSVDGKAATTLYF